MPDQLVTCIGFNTYNPGIGILDLPVLWGWRPDLNLEVTVYRLALRDFKSPGSRGLVPYLSQR
jgi:hypothetical protein